MQIQCAQCHDHTTEKWKHSDFRRFAACFARTRTEPLDPPKTMGLKRAVVVDIQRPLPRFARDPDLVPITQAEPTTLDGTGLGASPGVRGALAAWMTAKNNPWFAKAIVNRRCGGALPRSRLRRPRRRHARVEPRRDARAPREDERIDFVQQHGDDLKALIRTITATEAYQLAPAPVRATTAASAADAGSAERLWSNFLRDGPRPERAAAVDPRRPAGVEGVLAARNANVDRIRFQLYQRYAFLFDVDEDFEQTSFEGTVAQALTLLNGEARRRGNVRDPGRGPRRGSSSAGLRHRQGHGSLRANAHAGSERGGARLLGSLRPRVAHRRDAPERPPAPPATAPMNAKKKKGGPAKANKAPPGPDALTRLEVRDIAVHPDSRRQAYADLFWALLNSSEFIFNH